MIIRYWTDQLDLHEVDAYGDYDLMHSNVPPETCFRQVRETMEELAFRTAMTYTDEGRPSLYYYTTVKGISCYEVSQRSDMLEGVTLSREESRLHG